MKSCPLSCSVFMQNERNGKFNFFHYLQAALPQSIKQLARLRNLSWTESQIFLPHPEDDAFLLSHRYENVTCKATCFERNTSTDRRSQGSNPQTMLNVSLPTFCVKQISNLSSLSYDVSNKSSVFKWWWDVKQKSDIHVREPNSNHYTREPSVTP